MSANTTKYALATSFKQLLKKKPLDKITVKDICDGCEVNRQTFYYHFQDIYDLIEWIYTSAEDRILTGKKYTAWEEGLNELFNYALAEKEFVTSTYHSISREYLEEFLYRETFQYLYEIMSNLYAHSHMKEDDKIFLADFYKYAFVGFVLEWVRKGMKEDPSELIQKMKLVGESSFIKSIPHFMGDKDIK